MPRATARNGEYTFCPQLKACTYHHPFLGDVCAIEHQLQRQGTGPNTNRPDRFTRGAFELTADALGFVHHGQSVPRVGLTARQATTGNSQSLSHLTTNTYRYNLFLVIFHGQREPRIQGDCGEFGS